MNPDTIRRFDDAAAAENAAAPDSTINPIGRPRQPVSILLVDDEPKNLTVLESILNNPQYRLVRAESADQALLALVSEEFALLVLDIQMPGMNGFELAQMVKQRKKTAGVPIIFLTAFYSEDHHVLEGYGTGAVDYLHKPINPAVLRSKVSVFVELYCKSRELEESNRALLAEITARRQTQDELRLLTEELERRVTARTADLQLAQAALREADRLKDEFLATLAHELRNPLAPIRSAVQVMRLKADDRVEVDWARDIIDRQSKQLSRLVDDLLDVSRITTGKLTIQREAIDLQTIVARAVETSRPLLDDCQIALVVNLPEQPVVLNADPTRMAQVLSNLLNNAAKFSESGGTVRLTAQCDAREVQIAVQDSGVGIPADTLPHVFDMFSQGDKHLGRSLGGLGIGLTLVKRLVELHDGTVEARSGGSQPGSNFTVRLPLAGTSPIAEPQPPELAVSNTAVGLKVLVVDDNQDNANALRVMLKCLGHEVSTAYDGLAAMAAAESLRPDVILLDLGMPKLDGYEVCRRIRVEPWGQQTLLIAQTGWGQEQDRQRTREAGFDHHLVKPIPHVKLVTLLRDRVGEVRSGQSD
jgi:signal transduction histidine kinase